MKEIALASPIKIASGRDKPTRVLAHSAPTPSTHVPKAPSSRPKVPQRDPPVMMLPPSPPVFSPGQGPAAVQPARFVSDWTSMCSSSCPTTSYLDLGVQKKKEKEWSLTPLDEMDEPDEIVQPKFDDLSQLSQSPTIFSLLQRSLPTHTGVPFKVSEKVFVPSSRGVDTMATIAHLAESKPSHDLNDTEEIMFPMSMDGDVDSELAADAEQYLTFHA